MCIRDSCVPSFYLGNDVVPGTLAVYQLDSRASDPVRQSVLFSGQGLGSQMSMCLNVTIGSNLTAFAGNARYEQARMKCQKLPPSILEATGEPALGEADIVGGRTDKRNESLGEIVRVLDQAAPDSLEVFSSTSQSVSSIV